jgi:hypothetical protein
MRRQRVLLGACVLSFAACADMPADDQSGSSVEPIIRAKDEKRFPQVVAVHVTTFSGFTQCSGTYIASRVVITAAHCFNNGPLPGQTFVYHGKDYLTDRESLPTIPAPGEESDWARAETVTIHPLYSQAVNYPDLAILHLDRNLPFDPIPLYRQPVTSSIKKGEIIGWGGSRALVPDISIVEGAGIKRSAKIKILGSPTEADFIPEDPNPGILDPAIRADLLKTNGIAPSANPCAGDSGGPLLIKDKGKDFLAGVGFWTGLFCEDYSIFTRIDPFLDYFDEQIRRGGKAPIIPRLECVLPEADGSFEAYFSYNNENGVTVNIPHGVRNLFPRDTADARPEAFAPGDNPLDFSVPFAANQKLTWLLIPPGGPQTLVRADASSTPVCDPNSNQFLCAGQCDASLAAECASDGISRGQCILDCVSTADFFASFGCGAEWSAFLRCVAAVPPDAANWDCFFAGFPPFPASPTCEAELNAAFACLGY